MHTLAFDTSSQTASVAILHGQSVLYDTVLDTGRNHSEVLLPAIHEALSLSGVKMSDIGLLACTLGPGSFTGLRIGVSTLKGLMMATKKPAAGVSSLEALALNVGMTDKTIGAMLDAGRGQVYLAYYRCAQDGSLMRLSDEKAVSPDRMEAFTDKEVIYVGDGATKYAEALRKKSPNLYRIAPDEQQHIRASCVGMLGIRKNQSGDLLDVNALAPIYLRSADAAPAKSVFTQT